MADYFYITDLVATSITLTNSTGFELREGYEPEIAIPPGDGSIPPPVTERIPVIINNTSADNLASHMQDFHDLQRRASSYWRDRTQRTPVWFYAKLDGELSVTRSLVRSLDIEIEDQPYSDIPSAQRGINATIIMERHPYWEDFTTASISQSSALTGPCAIFDIGAVATINGDVPARIFWTTIDPSAGEVDSWWMGFRSDAKHVDASDFDPEWHCKDGTNNASESNLSDQADANADSGTCVNLTAAGADLDWDDEQLVCMIELRDVSSDEEEHLGDFYWLLRAKSTDASTSWRFRLGFKTAPSSTSTDYTEHVTFDSTTSSGYVVKGMGSYPITSRDVQALPFATFSENLDDWFNVSIYAQRITGSGGFRVDALYAIPTDEGFVSLYHPGSPAEESRAIYAQSPHDRDVAMGIVESVTEHWEEKMAISGGSRAGFRIPLGTTVLIIAMNHPLPASTVQIGPIYYYRRWLSFRGAE